MLYQILEIGQHKKSKGFGSQFERAQSIFGGLGAYV